MTKPDWYAPGSLFRQAQEARRDALQQHLADQRRDLARRASLSGAIDPDASLRAAQADATARADAPLGSTGAIGRVLPAVARASAGMAVANAKIWEADAKPLRRKIDAEAYLARVRQAAKTRETGDPLEPTLVRTAELVLWAVRKGGTALLARHSSSSATLSDAVGKPRARRSAFSNAATYSIRSTCCHGFMASSGALPTCI